MSNQVPLDSQFNWQGWRTDYAALAQTGWEITVKPSYENWKQPQHSIASTTKIYLRHPILKIIGRCTLKKEYSQLTDTYNCIYVLDFLTEEHNQRITASKILRERDLTSEDIPTLLDIIMSLQEENKKSLKKPSNNNILKFSGVEAVEEFINKKAFK